MHPVRKSIRRTAVVVDDPLLDQDDDYKDVPNAPTVHAVSPAVTTEGSISTTSGNEKVFQTGVLIIGAGVSGLTAAHRLVEAGYKRIIVVDSETDVGGVVRTSKTQQGSISESSWNIIGGKSDTLWSVMGDIPISVPTSDSSSTNTQSEQQSQQSEAQMEAVAKHLKTSQSIIQSAKSRLAGLARNKKKWTVRDNFTQLTDPFWFVTSSPENTDIASTSVDVDGTIVPSIDGISIRMTSKVSSLWRVIKIIARRLTIAQKYHVCNRVAYAIMCSNLRRRCELSEMTWMNFLNCNSGDNHYKSKARSIPKQLYPFLMSSTGPFTGVDSHQCSASSICEWAENWVASVDQIRPRSMMQGGVLVSKQSLSDSLFTPWRNWLTERGVTFMTTATVIKLNEVRAASEPKARIHSVQCAWTREPGFWATEFVTIQADWIISAVPIETLAALLPHAQHPESIQMRQLAAISRQDVVSVQMYWPESIKFPMPKTGVFLLDSRWQLVIYAQDAVWSASVSESDASKKSTSWIVMICDAQTPGVLTKRPWRECTTRQIYRDVWHQIHASKAFADACVVRKSDESSDTLAPNDNATTSEAIDPRPTLSKLHPSEWHFDSRYEEGSHGLLIAKPGRDTSSPNAGSLNLRPVTKSQQYSNFMHAGAWVKSGSRELMRLESAAFNGWTAADEVITADTGRHPDEDRKLRMSKKFAKGNERISPLLFAPIRVLDHIAYRVGGLSAPSRILGRHSFVFMILYILFVTLIITVGMQRMATRLF